MIYKIGFIGLPSSGKTTAANNLNKALTYRNIKTVVIPEFARDYMRAKGDRIRTAEEQIRCSQIQSDLESRALLANPEVMITDTPLFVTHAYTKMYYPENNQEINKELSEYHKYDYIFRCVGDTYKDDGVRFQTPKDLKRIEEIIEELATKYHKNPIITMPVDRTKRINFLDGVAKELTYGLRYNTDIIIR